jgi:hypothetical protein
MTLRKLVFTIEQPLFDVALHLGVVVYGVPQLSKRFGEFGFDLALKDFSLQWEGEGRSSMHVKHSKNWENRKEEGASALRCIFLNVASLISFSALRCRAVA